MRNKVKKVVSFMLLFVAMILFSAQAGIWARSTRFANTESDKINILSSHPPDELPGLIGLGVLTLAAVIASIPAKSRTQQHRHIHA
jgi:hypothetical protein